MVAFAAWTKSGIDRVLAAVIAVIVTIWGICFTIAVTIANKDISGFIAIKLQIYTSPLYLCYT